MILPIMGLPSEMTRKEAIMDTLQYTNTIYGDTIIKYVLIKLTHIVLLVFELLLTPHSTSAALEKIIINSSYKL